ncbi:MAG TPA: hypothetical protein PL051_00555 [Candidatus Saccharibacteria bacterium]|nr:hypothetical protein [Candidatus Saccharibacteria bacterium]
MRKIAALFALSPFLLAIGVLWAPQAHASTAGFQAGDIMNDTVMAKSKSMTVTQIQHFLDSKVPTCDTNGNQNSEMNNSGVPDYNGNGSIQRWEWGKKKYGQTKFVCLKNYSKNGKSAAQIIYDAGQTYSINPQSLIVLLQKEQGLVTDTWPLNIQYRTATGYGCPDTAPCDSQYYGLTNQLKWAAKMFRSIMDQDPDWYSPYVKGTNARVYWHPDTGRCGYASLNIRNWTTASLYSYTPYRPNQAALDAGYGTGNSCSSYGNRNFYSYFTDWFGSTRTVLVKVGSSPAIYLVWGSNYYPVPSNTILSAYGLTDKTVATVSQSQLDTYTLGPALSRVVRFGSDPTVFLVDGGDIHPVTSWGLLANYDYNSSDKIDFSDTTVKDLFSVAPTLKTLARKSDGSIYVADASKKRLFPDSATFSTLAASLSDDGTKSYSNLSKTLVDSLSDGSPVLLDGKIVKSKSTSTVYLYENNSLLPYSASEWSAWGKKLDYDFFSASSLSQITPAGDTPGYFATNGSTNYVVSGGKKYSMGPTTMTAWGMVNGDFDTRTNASLSRLSSAGSIGSLISNSSGGVYKVLSGAAIPYVTSGDFTGSGNSWSSVVKVPNEVISSLDSSSSIVFKPGSLIRQPNGAVSLIDSGFVRHSIPSMEIFNAYGFKWSSVRNYGQNSLDVYTDEPLKSLALVSGSTHYLADSGRLFMVSPTAYGSSQFNFSPSNEVALQSSKTISGLDKSKTLEQFITSSSSPIIYKVINGQKRPLASMASFYANGGGTTKLRVLSQTFIDSLPTGAVLN